MRGAKPATRALPPRKRFMRSAVTGEEEPQDQSAESAQAWLAGVSFHPDRPAIFFDMALRNWCKRLEEKDHCTFSHHPETFACLSSRMLWVQRRVRLS